MVCFKFFKGCLPQILTGPFLNTLSQIINELGHCIGYSLMYNTGAGLAQPAQLQATQISILPVKPSNQGETVITAFWLENFDMDVESAIGGGAINTTHMVVFQEEKEHTSLLYTHTTVERTKSRR